MFKAKRVYLDHAAATPVSKYVLKSMEEYWGNVFANPGAIHKDGVLAQRAVQAARSNIATILGVHTDEIIFTGSATESANLAIMGVVSARRKEDPSAKISVVLSEIEHAAVYENTDRLKKMGVDVRLVPVSSDGQIKLDVLRTLITEDTVLVSVMYVNNEIGTIQPIREIAKIIREKRKIFHQTNKDQLSYPYFHTDACQATNYLEVFAPRLGVDLLTINAAKIYGPKGIALLYQKREVKLLPMIVGGGQEGGNRAGTENVPLIMGFAAALQETILQREKESARITMLRDELLQKLKTIFPQLIVNGSMNDRVANNLNVSIEGVDHEQLVLYLDHEGVSISTKSACNELDADESHVLKAISVESQSNRPLNGLRITLGRATTKNDIAQVINAFIKVAKILNIRNMDHAV